MSSYLGIEPTDKSEYYFISYNNEDAERLQSLVQLMDRNQIPMWYDYGLTYGKKWRSEIAAHIRDCKAVILLLTKGILEKENSYVITEYEMATEYYDKPVYVILVDDIRKKDVPEEALAWWIDVSRKQSLLLTAYPKEQDQLREIRKMLQLPEPAAKPKKPQDDHKTATDAAAAKGRTASDSDSGKGSKPLPEEKKIQAEPASHTKRFVLIAAIVLCIAVGIKLFWHSSSGSGTTASAGSSASAQTAVENENVVTFGTYEQDNDTSNGAEDIEWLVLAEEDDRVLVISRYALDCQPYYPESRAVTWETCSLREWLNDDFYHAAFSTEEQSEILTTTVTADKNPEHDTDPGNDTQDQVFLLSAHEAEQYFTSDDNRVCAPTAYAAAQGGYDSSSTAIWWWLRSPGVEQEEAAYVYEAGAINCLGFGVFASKGAVRPAMWISRSALSDASAPEASTAASAAASTSASTSTSTANAAAEPSAVPTFRAEAAAESEQNDWQLSDLITRNTTSVTGSDSGNEVKIVYPWINLYSDEISQLNLKIRDEYCALSPMEISECIDVTYDCAINGDILSVAIIREMFNDYTVCYTANISISEERVITLDELAAAGGYESSESLYTALSDTLTTHITTIYRQAQEQTGGTYDASYISDFVDQSVEQENLEKAQFYLNSAGQMCAGTYYYFPAGSGKTASLLNLAIQSAFFVSGP